MKNVFTVIFAVFSLTVSLAQTPQQMSYQAVIRNAANELVANKQVGIKISILKESPSGSVVYAETHTAPTNSNGLVSIIIGSGTVVTGSLASVEWINGRYILKTETDPLGGNNYNITGTSQLLSVPYALLAKTAENVDDADADPNNEIQALSISGTQLTLNRGGGTVTLPSSGGGDNWGTQSDPRQLPSETELVGFIAQDVQKIFPEAVKMTDDGYFDFNIHAINVALVNAVKELKAENDLLKSKNEQVASYYSKMKSENASINARLGKLEQMIETSAMK